ncbi:MAG: hypothetical protein R3E89_03030 [Thiolinea sp.]
MPSLLQSTWLMDQPMQKTYIQSLAARPFIGYVALQKEDEQVLAQAGVQKLQQH